MLVTKSSNAEIQDGISTETKSVPFGPSATWTSALMTVQETSISYSHLFDRFFS